MADTPRSLSLLDELQTGSAFEAALLATYSSYAPFVEEVVLPRLRTSGCHFLTVLADRTQLACEFADTARRPSTAGRRYGLVPIACSGAFHPKLVIVVGPKRARVLIGSHNLTISGVIQNREVTNVIDIAGPKDRTGAAALMEAVEFCTAWAEPSPPALRALIDDFRTFCTPYFGPAPHGSETIVIGSRPSGPSLWQRLRAVLPTKGKRALVVGPFFDRSLSFVRSLAEELALREVVIGLDSHTACFPGNLKALPPKVRVVDAHDLSGGHRGRGLLHAKAILIEDAVGMTLVTGSANPTAAGWLAPPRSRNAELVVVRRLDEGADYLGLERLLDGAPVDAARLAGLRTRPEVGKGDTQGGSLLVGICHDTTVDVDGSFGSASDVTVRDTRGAEISGQSRVEPGRLVISLAERAHDASTIEAIIDGARRYGFVHHPDLLREAALSSSQRRVREALRGLSGDASQLEGLLRLIEKVIFDTPAVDQSVGRRAKAPPEPGQQRDRETSVAVVASLSGDAPASPSQLSGGDLGLLLDYLMRKLWQSLTHEPSSSSRSELELIDADDEEDTGEPVIADAQIAEAWHRKTRTLLRRLLRRTQEGGGPLQVVFEAAAVLGVLEAVRRVEDQDRWRPLNAEFVDREAASGFLIGAVPELLLPGRLLDRAVATVGGPFAEQRSLIEWLVWLAWLTGFGPADVWDGEEGDERAAQAERADRLARTCLIAARAHQTDAVRLLELLESSPFPGVDARQWLDGLSQFGSAYTAPGSAATLRRAPSATDLVVTLTGGGPYVVRCVRGDKADLIDLGREQQVVVFKTSALRALDVGIVPIRWAAAY